MKKYYIRFNPGHIFAKSSYPWQVIEVGDDAVYNKFFLYSVNIEVPTWTEISKEDRDYWNIACRGTLTVKDKQGKITSTV